MSGAIKPLLQFIDGYRRRVAAPEKTLMRKKYTRYADLSYISKRLKVVEDSTYGQIFEEKYKKGNGDAVGVDYMDGEAQSFDQDSSAFGQRLSSTAGKNNLNTKSQLLSEAN